MTGSPIRRFKAIPVNLVFELQVGDFRGDFQQAEISRRTRRAGGIAGYNRGIVVGFQRVINNRSRRQQPQAVIVIGVSVAAKDFDKKDSRFQPSQGNTFVVRKTRARPQSRCSIVGIQFEIQITMSSLKSMET